MDEWIEFDGQETSIHLDKLFLTLLRHIVVIIAATVAAAALLFAYAKFMVTPLYESSVRMYINNRSESSDTTNISSSDLTASQNLVKTYAVIMTNYETISEVIEKTHVDYTYEELCEMISTSSVNSTEIIEVTVTSPSAEEAAQIANAIADIAPDKIMDIVSGSSVKIVDYGRVAEEKSYPSVKRFTLIGAALGFLLSCFAVLLLAALRNGLTVEDKIKRDFNEGTVLASIPELGSSKKKGDQAVGVCEKMNFAAAESYKLLRTNLSFCFADNKKCHVIGVTSAIKSEGKSTTSVNLAYTLAQAGNSVCLIDCDMRLPTLYKKLSLNKKPGLVNLLVGQSDGHDVLQKYSGGGTTMRVMVSGDVPPNPSELLMSARMGSVLKALGKTFDYIVLDLPPVGVVTDALTVTKLVDGMILVVREDFYERRVLKDAVNMLDTVNAKMLGMVLTHSKTQQKEYKHYGSKYGYGYGYGYGSQAQDNANAEIAEPEDEIQW